MRDAGRMGTLAAALVAAAVLGAAAGAANATASAADTLRLGLEESLARALAAAPALAAADAAVDESQAAAAEAGARRRPVLGAGGAYQYTTEHMRRDLELGFGLPPRTLEFGDGHVADLNVGLALPLYTGGELSRTAAAAGAGVEAALGRAGSARLEVTRGVRLAWCGALGRQAQVDAAEVARARLARHLETVRGAREAGAASGEAEVRARARLVAAMQKLAQAEAARDSAALALGRLVGLPGAPVLARGDVTASLLAGAADTLAGPDPRPDLAALGHEAQRQRELAAAARGRLRPRILGDVRAHYGRPGVDALANDWMGYGTAGVSVDWPLWDSGARGQRARQAEARAAWVESQRRELDEALAVAQATARRNLRAALAQSGQAAERADLQRELLAMVESRRAQSAATETECLDAHDDLAQAEIELAAARTRVRLAEAALLWALGR